MDGWEVFGFYLVVDGTPQGDQNGVGEGLNGQEMEEEGDRWGGEQGGEGGGQGGEQRG